MTTMPNRFASLPPDKFTAEARRLMRLACPDDDSRPRFHALMAKAKAQGMTYIEGLEFAAGKRDEF